MNKEKEIPFFKKMIMSIKNFEKYPEFASKKWSIVAQYLIKLLVLFTIIVSFCSVYNLSKQVKEAVLYIDGSLPDFTYENNILKMEKDEPIIIENEGKVINVIIINTKEQIDEEELAKYKEKVQNSQNGVIFLENKVIINNKEILYSELAKDSNIQSFNKQELLNFFSSSNLAMMYIGIYIITFIYLLIMYMASTCLDIILLGAFGYIAAKFMRLRLRFEAMCKIAVHSLTLPILLNALTILLYTFTGFKITYFDAMYMGIACIYIVAAILMIKSDVVKNQKELAKIIEEQLRIKMEMEKGKENKKQEEKEKEDEEEQKEEKKEKKEDKEDEGLQNNAQGENA